MTQAVPVPHLLEQQKSHLLGLQQVLEQEFVTLKERALPRLAEITQQKYDLLQALTQTDQQLAQFVEHLDGFAEEVDALRQLQQHCQQQNQVNGELLNLQQSSLNRLQSILSQARGNPGMTYDGSGRAQNSGSLGTSLRA